jgi:sulfate adenylyltransferase
VDDYVLMDVEQIALGSFSPLEGFVNSDELESILNEMRLPNDVLWPLPIILPVDEADAKNVKEKETVSLVRKRDKKIYATLLIEEIYKVDKFKVCKKWFGTTHLHHPGVFYLMSRGDYFIAGKVNLLKRVPTPHKHYELTPSQTRKIFKEKGWSIVVGFHTRNPIHRAHEYIQRKALEEIRGDGLFIHPVVGQKKKGDFEAHIVVKSYEIMMENYYPKKKALVGAFWTYPRYGGPREALFSAICRQNFGCSHFIVGRDHTGVNHFYHSLASHEIFGKFPELKIRPVFFDEVFYSKKHKKYFVQSGKNDAHNINYFPISGSDIKQTLSENKMPPVWLMRPKIAKMIFDQKENGSKRIFVE